MVQTCLKNGSRKNSPGEAKRVVVLHMWVLHGNVEKEQSNVHHSMFLSSPLRTESFCRHKHQAESTFEGRDRCKSASAVAVFQQKVSQALESLGMLATDALIMDKYVDLVSYVVIRSKVVGAFSTGIVRSSLISSVVLLGTLAMTCTVCFTICTEVTTLFPGEPNSHASREAPDNGTL